MRSCTPHLGCASRLRTVRVPRSIVSRAASAQASAEVVATSDGGAGHGFSQAHTSQRSAGAQILPHARIPPLVASGCFVSCAPPRLHHRRLGTVTDAASRGLSSLLLMMIAIWHTIGPFLKTPAHKSLPPCTMHSLSPDFPCQRLSRRGCQRLPAFREGLASMLCAHTPWPTCPEREITRVAPNMKTTEHHWWVGVVRSVSVYTLTGPLASGPPSVLQHPRRARSHSHRAPSGLESRVPRWDRSPTRRSVAPGGS